MNNLCFGMKVINITQLPGGDLSHPNGAVDLAGSDSGIDFYFAQGPLKCIAGPWGSGTYFFVPVDANGVPTKVHCADGVDRIVTLALTHSERKYIKTTVGKIYPDQTPCYEEGKLGKATGNHIHLEVAEGIRESKYYDKKLKVYRMEGELDPIKTIFVNKSFSTVTNTHGATLKYCDRLEYVPPVPWKKGDVLFVADKSRAAIRKTLDFSDGRPIGTILATMPKGAKAKITHFTNRHEKDAQGFEWFQVRYITPTGDTVDGYVQGDLSAYLVKIAT